MLTDTHPEAEAVQRELLRRMSASQKLSLVSSLTATVVSLCKQGIRDRHPEYSERDVAVHFVEMNYGKDLAVGFRKRLERDDQEIAGWADRLKVRDLWNRVLGESEISNPDSGFDL